MKKAKFDQEGTAPDQRKIRPRRCAFGLIATALLVFSPASAQEPASETETAPPLRDDPIADLIRAGDGVSSTAPQADPDVALPAQLVLEPEPAAPITEVKPAVEAAPATIAENPPAAPIAPTPVADIENGRAEPAMWRLADEDSEVWLLGTFHILPPGLDWRSDALARAVDAAETIYFEAEVDDKAAQQKTVSILMKEGFNPKGVTLSGLLGAEDAARLERIAEELNLPVKAIDPMRPWQAFLTLSIQFIVNQGFDPGSGVETVLLREARIRGRNLRFFETVEEQIGLFTSLPPDVEKNLLVLTLREWDSQESQFQTLFNAWRNGDTQTIDALMNEAMRSQAPEVYDALLADRNKEWADEIAEVMAGSGKVLVAVGAAHLVGDQSVPALLREKGFEVTRYGVDE